MKKGVFFWVCLLHFFSPTPAGTYQEQHQEYPHSHFSGNTLLQHVPRFAALLLHKRRHRILTFSMLFIPMTRSIRSCTSKNQQEFLELLRSVTCIQPKIICKSSFHIIYHILSYPLYVTLLKTTHKPQGSWTPGASAPEGSMSYY